MALLLQWERERERDREREREREKEIERESGEDLGFRNVHFVHVP